MSIEIIASKTYWANYVLKTGGSMFHVLHILMFTITKNGICQDFGQKPETVLDIEVKKRVKCKELGSSKHYTCWDAGSRMASQNAAKPVAEPDH